MHTPSSDPTAAARLTVTRDGDSVCVHQLEPGSYVLVGSSDVCGLTIPDTQLAPIHFALRWESGQFCVEDWHSELGVIVDGERVDAEQHVSEKNDIRFGTYRLVIDTAPLAEPVLESDDAGESATSTPLERAEMEKRTTEDESPADDSPPACAEPAGVETTTTAPVIEPAKPAVQRDVLADLRLSDRELESVDSEAVDLLRAEVEQLQYELAERDAQLMELAERNGTASQDEFDGGEDDALLLRLDDMLAELERNDERYAMLEQLLAASEEQNRAEQEERRHLTEWVNDIEERLGEREAEWQAERSALDHRVTSVLGERDELMRRMAEQPTDQPGAAAPDLETRSQLHAAQDRISELEELLRERDSQLASKSEADAAVREEHLKLAQERAALARQQAEMAAKLAEADKLPSKPENEIDCRLREFREHLREIHNEERSSAPQTVSSKLSRIWARLDGRA